MITFQTISDLHLDQLKYPYMNMIEKIIKPCCSIIVLGGDICFIENIDKHYQFFEYISQNFEYVVYVPGNHEFYNNNGKTIEELETYIEFFLKKYTNIYYLNNRSMIIEDILFTGSCLWCNPILQDPPPWFHINIKKDEIRDLYIKSINYLNKVSKLKGNKKHVLITHYPPIRLRSYYDCKEYENFFENSSKYKKYEEYYENNNIILEFSPDLWIFGHTHMNFDKYIDGTRYISNQRKDKKYCKNFLIDI